MRPLLLLALVFGAALAATASADAAVARTPGSESFSLRNGSGTAVIWQRGSLLGRIRRGRLVVIDLPTPGSPTVIVRGHETKRVLNESTTEYRGRDISFRVFGGGWRVRIRGRGIHVSGVARGWLRLGGTSGTFAVGDAPFRPWPRTPQLFKLAT